MIVNKKTIRYYYWLIREFVRKHIKLIFLSFLLSFICIISFISIAPFIETYFTTDKQVVGLVGNYDVNSVPDEVLTKVTNGLTYVDEKGKVVPILASSWEIKNNGKEYVIHLKRNLLWNNGTAFTAKDIHYNFKDVETKVVDDYTVRFLLKKPLPIFLTYLTKPIVKYPLVGVAGLYEIDHFKTEFGKLKQVDLSPNKTSIPRITYKFYDNESSLFSAYKKGEINEFTTTNKNTADLFSTWKNTTISKSIDYSRLLTLFFNFNSPLFKEKEVRQAIGMSIDPQKTVDNGERAIGPIPPISWAFNTDTKNDIYDMEASKKIIRKSLNASGSAELNFITYYDYLSEAEEIVDNLKELGFKVNLVVSSFDKPNDFDVLLAYWKVPYDPDQYYFWHSTQKVGNIGNYNNVKVDLLLERGRNAVKQTDRKEIYDDYQRVMMDDPPATFLYYPYIYTIKRK